MKLQDRRGVLFPAKMKFRSWIVAGPPGSGKSYLIQKIGGWPGEVCLDITMKRWWAVEPLTHRPREVHFALPFKDADQRYPVYDDKWLGAKKLPELDVNQIRIPTKKKFILAPDWRARFVFDFVLPPPEWLFEVRRKRLESGDPRLVDIGITPELVAWQVGIHWQLAQFFHGSGLQVMVRPFNTARPYSLPALQKIMRKKGKPTTLEVRPSLDWSRLRSIRSWIRESAAGRWLT